MGVLVPSLLTGDFDGVPSCFDGVLVRLLLGVMLCIFDGVTDSDRMLFGVLLCINDWEFLVVLHGLCGFDGVLVLELIGVVVCDFGGVLSVCGMVTESFCNWFCLVFLGLLVLNAGVADAADSVSFDVCCMTTSQCSCRSCSCILANAHISFSFTMS